MSTLKRKRRRQGALTPTSDLVAILSSIAATLPTVHASQPPPDYLCPTLSSQKESRRIKREKYSQHQEGQTEEEREMYEVATGRGSVSRANVRRSPVVDRYVPGEDGKWRKASDYGWYGHSCKPCDPTPSASASASYELDTVDPTTNVLNVSLNYPPGWNQTKDTTREDLPAIIMALSIALAVLICVFTIGWMFWRRRGKSRSSKGRSADDDVEGRHRQREREKRGVGKEQSMQKQKLWARASARWRSNVRLTARRRRADQVLRHSSSTLAVAPSDHSASATPSTTVPTSVSENAQVSQTPSSRTLTPEEESSDSTSQSSPCRSEDDPQESNAPDSPSSSSPPLAPSSPPAYIHPPQLPSASSSKSPPLQTSDGGVDAVLSSGHIATDDKLVLAQRAQLVSAPDFDFDPSTATTSSTAPVRPMVPEWQDEQLEDFRDHHFHISLPTTSLSTDGLSPSATHLNPNTDSNTNTSWPSPPTPLASTSKSQMAAFEQQYAMFPEYTEAEPELGPSAPPFEETEVYEGRVRAERGVPSAPPIELQEASAPPAEYGEDAEVHASPCAPLMSHADQEGDESCHNQSRQTHNGRSSPTPIASAPPIENG